MSQKQFLVQLSTKERELLLGIIRSGKHKARKITRCRILLLADGPNGKTDQEIADALNVSLGTIFGIRRRYFQEGLEAAISERPRSGQPSKFKGKAAAKITAIACSSPPAGQAKWSLRLLADRVVELKIVDSISHQSIRNILKKTSSNRT
jgi:putative transposase